MSKNKKEIKIENPIEILMFIYQAEGFEAIKDFMLMGIRDATNCDELLALSIVFNDEKLRSLITEKEDFNALVKVWLEEVEKRLRLK